MPPLASRLVRIRRAIRSQRVSSPARSGAPSASTNAGSPGPAGIPSCSRSSRQRVRSGPLGKLGDGHRGELRSGLTPAAIASRGEPGLARDQRLALEALAQRGEGVVVGLAREGGDEPASRRRSRR